MKKLLFVIVAITSSLLPVYAQIGKKNYDANKALPWVAGDLPQNSDKVRYKVAYGEGETYLQAREEATTVLISELGWENGVTITSKTIDEVKHSVNNNESNFSQNRNTTTTIVQDAYSVTITKVDEYSEIDRDSHALKYKVWQLYAIDCMWADKINLKYTTNYGFKKAGWRSLLVPGWGQIYKKQYVRGALYFGGEVAGIASAVYFHNQYNSNIKKSKETPILPLKKEFTDRADKQKLYRDISIGACAVIWIANVIDATLLEGRPRYVDSKVNFDITATPTNDVLFTLKYNLK